jgi:phosphonate transport system substrate-binding protein
LGGTGPRLAWGLFLVLLLPVVTGSEAPEDDAVLRLGVVNSPNPRSMYLRFQPLVDHLTSATGQEWELAVTSSYAETVEAFCTGDLALAYFGPLSYLRAHARCGAEPLLRLRTRGRDLIYSDLLVRADSPFERLEDLAGHRIGFGDALSTSSHLVPRAMLQASGLEPGRDVACRYYAGHERAARAVLLGEVEACGVRDLIGEVFLHRGLRRIARSGPIPSYPLATPPGTPAVLREALVSALLAFPGATEPRRPDEGWDLALTDGFVPALDSDYDPVRRLADRVFGPGAARRAEEELRCR